MPSPYSMVRSLSAVSLNGSVMPGKPRECAAVRHPRLRPPSGGGLGAAARARRASPSARRPHRVLVPPVVLGDVSERDLRGGARAVQLVDRIVRVAGGHLVKHLMVGVERVEVGDVQAVTHAAAGHKVLGLRAGLADLAGQLGEGASVLQVFGGVGRGACQRGAVGRGELAEVLVGLGTGEVDAVGTVVGLVAELVVGGAGGLWAARAMIVVMPGGAPGARKTGGSEPTWSASVPSGRVRSARRASSRCCRATPGPRRPSPLPAERHRSL